MTTATLGRWGNATALRIPLPFCNQLGLEAGSTVNLFVEGSRIVIEPTDEEFTLKGRMAAWDGQRFKTSEYDWGEPQGRELW